MNESLQSLIQLRDHFFASRDLHWQVLKELIRIYGDRAHVYHRAVSPYIADMIQKDLLQSLCRHQVWLNNRQLNLSDDPAVYSYPTSKTPEEGQNYDAFLNNHSLAYVDFILNECESCMSTAVLLTYHASPTGSPAPLGLGQLGLGQLGDWLQAGLNNGFGVPARVSEVLTSIFAPEQGDISMSVRQSYESRRAMYISIQRKLQFYYLLLFITALSFHTAQDKFPEAHPLFVTSGRSGSTYTDIVNSFEVSVVRVLEGQLGGASGGDIAAVMLLVWGMFFNKYMHDTYREAAGRYLNLAKDHRALEGLTALVRTGLAGSGEGDASIASSQAGFTRGRCELFASLASTLTLSGSSIDSYVEVSEGVDASLYRQVLQSALNEIINSFVLPDSAASADSAVSLLELVYDHQPTLCDPVWADLLAGHRPSLRPIEMVPLLSNPVGRLVKTLLDDTSASPAFLFRILSSLVSSKETAQYVAELLDIPLPKRTVHGGDELALLTSPGEPLPAHVDLLHEQVIFKPSSSVSQSGSTGGYLKRNSVSLSGTHEKRYRASYPHLGDLLGPSVGVIIDIAADATTDSRWYKVQWLDQSTTWFDVLFDTLFHSQTMLEPLFDALYSSKTTGRPTQGPQSVAVSRAATPSVSLTLTRPVESALVSISSPVSVDDDAVIGHIERVFEELKASVALYKSLLLNSASSALTILTYIDTKLEQYLLSSHLAELQVPSIYGICVANGLLLSDLAVDSGPLVTHLLGRYPDNVINYFSGASFARNCQRIIAEKKHGALAAQLSSFLSLPSSLTNRLFPSSRRGVLQAYYRLSTVPRPSPRLGGITYGAMTDSSSEWDLLFIPTFTELLVEVVQVFDLSVLLKVTVPTWITLSSCYAFTDLLLYTDSHNFGGSSTLIDYLPGLISADTPAIDDAIRRVMSSSYLSLVQSAFYTLSAPNTLVEGSALWNNEHCIGQFVRLYKYMLTYLVKCTEDKFAESDSAGCVLICLEIIAYIYNRISLSGSSEGRVGDVWKQLRAPMLQYASSDAMLPAVMAWVNIAVRPTASLLQLALFEHLQARPLAGSADQLPNISFAQLLKQQQRAGRGDLQEAQALLYRSDKRKKHSLSEIFFDDSSTIIVAVTTSLALLNRYLDLPISSVTFARVATMLCRPVAYGASRDKGTKPNPFQHQLQSKRVILEKFNFTYDNVFDLSSSEVLHALDMPYFPLILGLLNLSFDTEGDVSQELTAQLGLACVDVMYKVVKLISVYNNTCPEGSPQLSVVDAIGNLSFVPHFSGALVRACRGASSGMLGTDEHRDSASDMLTVRIMTIFLLLAMDHIEVFVLMCRTDTSVSSVLDPNGSKDSSGSSADISIIGFILEVLQRAEYCYKHCPSLLSAAYRIIFVLVQKLGRTASYEALKPLLAESRFWALITVPLMMEDSVAEPVEWERSYVSYDEGMLSGDAFVRLYKEHESVTERVTAHHQRLQCQELSLRIITLERYGAFFDVSSAAGAAESGRLHEVLLHANQEGRFAAWLGRYLRVSDYSAPIAKFSDKVRALKLQIDDFIVPSEPQISSDSYRNVIDIPCLQQRLAVLQGVSPLVVLDLLSYAYQVNYACNLYAAQSSLHKAFSEFLEVYTVPGTPSRIKAQEHEADGKGMRGFSVDTGAHLSEPPLTPAVSSLRGATESPVSNKGSDFTGDKRSYEVLTELFRLLSDFTSVASGPSSALTLTSAELTPRPQATVTDVVTANARRNGIITLQALHVLNDQLALFSSMLHHQMFAVQVRTVQPDQAIITARPVYEVRLSQSKASAHLELLLKLYATLASADEAAIKDSGSFLIDGSAVSRQHVLDAIHAVKFKLLTNILLLLRCSNRTTAGQYTSDDDALKRLATNKQRSRTLSSILQLVSHTLRAAVNEDVSRSPRIDSSDLSQLQGGLERSRLIELCSEVLSQALTSNSGDLINGALTIEGSLSVEPSFVSNLVGIYTYFDQRVASGRIVLQRDLAPEVWASVDVSTALGSSRGSSSMPLSAKLVSESNSVDLTYTAHLALVRAMSDILTLITGAGLLIARDAVFTQCALDLYDAVIHSSLLTEFIRGVSIGSFGQCNAATVMGYSSHTATESAVAHLWQYTVTYTTFLLQHLSDLSDDRATHLLDRVQAFLAKNQPLLQLFLSADCTNHRLSVRQVQITTSIYTLFLTMHTAVPSWRSLFSQSLYAALYRAAYRLLKWISLVYYTYTTDAHRSEADDPLSLFASIISPYEMRDLILARYAHI